jgi:Flp pilus assembly protein TadB
VNADTAAAAVFSGTTVGLAALRVAHVRRSPQRRMAFYLENPRSQLGGPAASAHGPAMAGEALWRVLGPLAGALVSLASRPLRHVPGGNLPLALRQAGVGMTADAYRRQYLRWLVATPLVLGGLGVATGRAVFVLLFFAMGVYAGGRRLPERLKALTKRRNEAIRSDLPTVAAVLALKVESHKSLVVAVSELVAQGSGPVVEDLARALHLINAGYGEAASWELVSVEAAEPAARRFYRFLAAATSGGLDLAQALLDQANEMRAQRREEVERSALRRQMSLVVPQLVFMAPVLFAFLLAPLPALLFGK